LTIDRDNPPRFRNAKTKKSFETDWDKPPEVSERENQESFETAELSLQWAQQ